MEPVPINMIYEVLYHFISYTHVASDISVNPASPWISGGLPVLHLFTIFGRLYSTYLPHSIYIVQMIIQNIITPSCIFIIHRSHHINNCKYLSSERHPGRYLVGTQAAIAAMQTHRIEISSIS